MDCFANTRNDNHDGGLRIIVIASEAVGEARQSIIIAATDTSVGADYLPQFLD